jgi:hypothetical protein
VNRDHRTLHAFAPADPVGLLLLASGVDAAITGTAALD